MNENRPVESSILDKHEPSWVARGYRLVRQPGDAELPDFLRNCRPDALLLGCHPQIVVEIVRKGQTLKSEKVQQLKALLADRHDWRLEVLYTGQAPEELPAMTTERLRELLTRVRQLAAHESHGSLLLLWATLEAVSRRLEPIKAIEPQSAGRVVELLASAGFVTPSEAEELRDAEHWRNRLAHGDFDVAPSKVELSAVASIVEGLIAQVERRNGDNADL